MSLVNQWNFIGRVGSIKTNGSGETKRLEVSLGVDDSYKDDDKNEWVERTNWIVLSSFNESIIAKFDDKLRVGDLIAASGVVRSWSKGEGDDRKFGYNFVIGQTRFLSRSDKNKDSKGDESDS